MGFADLVVILVVAGVMGLAGWYIFRSKKSGKKCIGCPDGCSGSCGSCGCGCGRSK